MKPFYQNPSNWQAQLLVGLNLPSTKQTRIKYE